MKSEDLSNPGVPGLIKELSSRVSNIESKIKVEEGAEDEGLVTREDTENYIDGYPSESLRKLDKIPISNLYDDFECSSCGFTHLVAVKIQCAKCDAETWWGYHPK